MDRRTWLQLISVLAAARPQHAQQPGQSLPPMRVNKDHIAGALKLMELEFQDAEIAAMLRERQRASN